MKYSKRPLLKRSKQKYLQIVNGYNTSNRDIEAQSTQYLLPFSVNSQHGLQVTNGQVSQQSSLRTISKSNPELSSKLYSLTPLPVLPKNSLLPLLEITAPSTKEACASASTAAQANHLSIIKSNTAQYTILDQIEVSTLFIHSILEEIIKTISIEQTNENKKSSKLVYTENYLKLRENLMEQIQILSFIFYRLERQHYYIINENVGLEEIIKKFRKTVKSKYSQNTINDLYHLIYAINLNFNFPPIPNSRYINIQMPPKTPIEETEAFLISMEDSTTTKKKDEKPNFIFNTFYLINNILIAYTFPMSVLYVYYILFKFPYHYMVAFMMPIIYIFGTLHNIYQYSCNLFKYRSKPYNLKFLTKTFERKTQLGYRILYLILFILITTVMLFGIYAGYHSSIFQLYMEVYETIASKVGFITEKGGEVVDTVKEKFNSTITYINTPVDIPEGSFIYYMDKFCGTISGFFRNLDPTNRN